MVSSVFRNLTSRQLGARSKGCVASTEAMDPVLTTSQIQKLILESELRTERAVASIKLGLEECRSQTRLSVKDGKGLEAKFDALKVEVDARIDNGILKIIKQGVAWIGGLALLAQFTESLNVKL